VAFEIVVIGTSLGGLSALQVLLGGLTDNFSAAIAIAQHRHKESDAQLSQFLQHHSPMPIKEAEDKDLLRPGHIYLAPPDYHLLVEPGYFSLSTDEPVSYARPSIDVLFESAADSYRERTIGVLLTGANRDGTQGLARIAAHKGHTIVQDPASAENATMPQAAIQSVTIDRILPLSDIAPYLTHLCCSVRR
jgi:two-component system, chemotaxis family, protein-glutamate methylesterase/glutaminase